jgi:L-amino acid N-acyltransferase YncA
MIIREATLADAEGVAQVHAASWRTTYSGIVPDDVIARVSDPARRLAQWQALLGDATSGESVFVAEDDDGRLIGFASCGPTRSGDADAARYPGELYAIYLLQTAQGRGVGRQLARAVAVRLAEQQIHAMIVWVFADNPARRFYEALGGQFVREQTFTMGGVELREAGYGWPDTSVLR